MKLTPLASFGGRVVLVLLLGLRCGGGSAKPTGGGTGGAEEEGGQGGGTGGKGGSGGGGKGGASGSGGTMQVPDSGATADAAETPAPDAALDGAAVAVEGGSSVPAMGLGPWTGKDNVPPSTKPPGGLDPSRVPMFVSLGFDDNPNNEGVNWAMGVFSALKNPAGKGNAATYDGTTTRATFYNTSTYTAAASSWKAAYNAGFETGNHTINHFHGGTADNGMNFTAAGWTRELQGCIDYHTGSAVGMKRTDMVGFRTPFLQYNANLFPVLKTLGFWYDCSIEEGHQVDQDGTNYLWPYTLDTGSPGNASHPRLTPITTWPTGLWEMPAYKVILPPDAEAQKYGVPAGLRAKYKALRPMGVGIDQGKITGLDYNLFSDYGLSKAEFVATLKYTLDLRRRGNRAPFLFGMHSAIYTAQGGTMNAPLADRRAAIVEFLNYALTYPEIRIVTTKAVLDWVRNPVPLD